MNSTAKAPPPKSVAAALQYPIFTAMWASMVVSNLGVWITDIASAWLMTAMTSSPIYVALLQFCVTLPIFLFAVPSGWLGDRVDRRAMLLVIQIMLTINVGLLAFVVYKGAQTPLLLLAFTFVSGVGLATASPIRQAVLPMLVPRTHLRSAFALNAIGFNGSRAAGPAIGGVLLATYGAAAALLATAVAYLSVVAVLISWRPKKRQRPAQLGNLVSDMRETTIMLLGHPLLRACLVRQFSYFAFASAVWALAPLIARSLSGGDPMIFSLCIVAIGAGSVLGGLPAPSLQARFGVQRVVQGATAMSAIAIFLLAAEPGAILSIIAFFAFGVGWIAVSAVLNATFQTAVDDAQRARTVSIFLVGFAIAMMAGSVVWGFAAAGFGRGAALACAAGLLALTLLLPRWAPIIEEDA